MTDLQTINAENPWPWLESFPETASNYFNGRDQNTDALKRCVLSAPVTILFGKYGLGKSSILKAGLFPRLRTERLLPVYVRLSHEENSCGVAEQLAKRYLDEVANSRVTAFKSRSDSTVISDIHELLTDSLWAFLHRADIELSDEDGQRWNPIFVLDQFEEIFTLCAANPDRQQEFFFELGDLMENRIPKTLAERLHNDDAFFDLLSLNGQPYRFLISLHEDYLPDLEEWADRYPRLGPNRYRLLPMADSQAIEAIEKTGGDLVTHEGAINIVNYLSQSQNQNEFGEEYRRKLVTIEPALLSLMCSGLNAERLKNYKLQLETSNLSMAGGLIIENFYDAAFTGLPELSRDFVEQNLITTDGARLSYPISSVQKEQLITPEHIKTLVNTGLIRRENLGDGDRIELVHDRLAQVALSRRKDGLKRKELLNMYQSRRRKLIWSGAVLFVCVAAAFSISLIKAISKAKIALREATALRLVVEGMAMASGQHLGGTTKGVYEVLAAHRIFTPRKRTKL